jgi:hypothetical protein
VRYIQDFLWTYMAFEFLSAIDDPYCSFVCFMSCSGYQSFDEAWNLHLLVCGYHNTPYHKLDQNGKTCQNGDLLPSRKWPHTMCYEVINSPEETAASDLGSHFWSFRHEVALEKLSAGYTLNGVTTQKGATFPTAALGTFTIVNFHLYCCRVGTK